jgi:ABC-type multidrug transport system ATPase subunit
MTGRRLELREVLYKYRKQVQPALNRVSFDLAPGRVTGLAGHNGAGKSTSILLLCGALRPLEGVVLLDKEVLEDVPTSGFGVLTEKLALYDLFSVWETAEVFARMKGCEDPHVTAQAALDRWGLTEHREKWVRALSSGLRKRLLICVVTLDNPEVILLDEPFSGLDPVSVRLLSEEITRWRNEGRTVLVSSHDLPELESVSDEVVILRNGTVAMRWDGDPAALRRYFLVTSEGDLEFPSDVEGLSGLVERLRASGARIEGIRSDGKG